MIKIILEHLRILFGEVSQQVSFEVLKAWPQENSLHLSVKLRVRSLIDGNEQIVIRMHVCLQKGRGFRIIDVDTIDSTSDLRKRG